MKSHHLGFLLLALLASSQVMGASPPGRVIGWGKNPILGCDGIAFYNFPTNGEVNIAGKPLNNVIDIAAGSRAFALKADGTVFEWRINTEGSGSYTNGMVIIGGNVASDITSISEAGLALKRDGTLVGMDGQFIPNGLSNITAISTAGGHCLALRSDGTVAAWGAYARVPKGLNNVVAIAASSPYSYGDIALRKDGTVVQWRLRDPHEGQVTITNPDDAVAEMPYNQHEYDRATNVDGSVTNIGNVHQEYRLVEGVGDVVAIAAGEMYSLAIKRNGTVFGWGDNRGGQATGSTNGNYDRGLVKLNGKLLANVVAIAAGRGHTFSGYSLALRKDGTIAAWGATPENMPVELGGITAIAAGNGFCLVVTTNTAMPKLKEVEH